MKVRSLLRAAAFTLALQFAANASAATLIVDSNGILTGATGVDVGGTLYDVQFVDSTCAVAFGVCEVSSFPFTTQADAVAAAQALLDQVFLDGPLGQFDSQAGLTFGCALAAGSCLSLVPYYAFGGGVQAAGASNHSVGVPLADSVSGTWSFGASGDMSANNVAVIARFTAISSAVPEPATWAMMLFGFGAIGFSMRRRRSLMHLTQFA